jgi:hypothetical protein
MEAMVSVPQQLASEPQQPDVSSTGSADSAEACSWATFVAAAA